MTMDEKLRLMLYEAAANDIITESEKDEMIQYVSEKFTTKEITKTSPLKKELAALKRIKDQSRDECESPAAVKEFIDKNYDKLEKITQIAENEPEALTNKVQTSVILWLLSEIITLTIIGAPIGLVMWVLAIIGIITSILRKFQNDDAKKELEKIENALRKIDTKKLPEATVKKVKKLINDIDAIV